MSLDRWPTLLCGLLIAGVAACGGAPRPEGKPEAPGPFVVRLLPDGFAPPPRTSLVVSRRGADLEACLSLLDAERIKALYVELAFDESVYEPVSARSTGLLWAGAGPGAGIELAVLDQPGRAIHGQLLARPSNHRGFSGSGAAVRFFFRERRRPLLPVRRANLAPATEASRAALSMDALNTALNWTYYCQGDFDQNGEVNIADLTPLGIHFGQSGPFLPNSVEAVVDGDGNGEINLADLTAIGLNYGRRVTAYRIFESANAADYPAGNDSPSTIQALGSTELHAGDPTQERLRYSFTLNEIGAGNFYWVRPIDGAPLDAGASEGTPSNMVSDADPGNLPPVAVVAANPAVGLAPLQLRVSAAESGDPDGEIVLYEWDFNGDGLYDLTTLDSFTDLLLSEPGEHIIAVRVTDNAGATAGNGVLVVTTAPDGWRLSLPFVNPSLDVWADEISEPQALEGHPAIVVENDDAGYFLCRATNAEATEWPAPRPVDAGGLHSDSFSFGVVEGMPTLAFAGGGNSNLYWMRATHPLGYAWGATQQILAYDGAYRPRLAVSGNGRPLLAFLGTAGAGWSINALLSADAQGGAWGDHLEIAGGDDFYSSPALGLLGGEPAVAFQDGAYNSVCALSVGEPDGSLWELHTAFDPPPLNGESFFTPAFAEVEGRPALAFGFAPPGDPERLAYVRADDAAGAGWPAPQLVGDAGALACPPALFIFEIWPVIAYATELDGGLRSELKIVKGLDREGSAWDPPLSVGVFPDIRRLGAEPVQTNNVRLAFLTDADHDDPRLHCRSVCFAVEE